MGKGLICKQTDPDVLNYSSKPSFQSQDDLIGKWTKSPVTYAVVRGTNDVPRSHLYFKAVNLAFTIWELECKLKLKVVKSTENPDITVKWVPGIEDEYFGSDSSILAWAGYPFTQFQGQLVLNDDKIWSTDGKSIDAATYTRITGKPVANPANRFKTYNMNQTLRHEIGHLLGLSHSISCPLCIMNPTYNETLDLQPNDILRARAKYGKRIFLGDWYNTLKLWIRYKTTGSF